MQDDTNQAHKKGLLSWNRFRFCEGLGGTPLPNISLSASPGHILTRAIRKIFLSLLALLDNYEADENRPEKSNATELLEEDALIDTMVVSGGPMDIAFQYLKDKGSISFNVNTAFDFLYPICYPLICLMILNA